MSARGARPAERPSAFALLVLTLLLAVQGSVLVSEAARRGPAADEPRHLGTGAWQLATGVCCIGYHDTPSTTLATWAFLRGRDPGFALPRRAPPAHEMGVRVIEARPDARRRLLAARLTNLPFAFAMTGALFLLGRRLAGDAGGLLAAAAAALDPSLLAHGHLISPDFLSAACLPVAALAAVRLVERPTLPRGAVLGVALAALLLAKYSALLPAGVLVLAAALVPGTEGDGAPLRERLRARAGPLATALGIALLLLLAAFRFPAVPWFYPVGLRLTRKLVEGGYPSFLLGEYGRGWLSYFVVAVLVKVPVPTLLAAGAGAVALVRAGRRALAPAFALLALPVAALFATASATRFDIGIRHVLPVVPALALAAAGAILPWHGRVRAFTIAALVALLAPSLQGGVAFGNALARLAGGIDAVLSDSNVDWGEDVPRLVEWRRANPEGTLAAALFAPLPLPWYGLDAIELPGTTVHAPRRRDPLPADLRWFAISVLDLQGTMLRDHDRYALFRTRRPVAAPGGTIRVFDVSADPEARAALEEIRRGP